MYFLSFETSTKIFSLALNKDGKVLRYRNLPTASVLEDAILPAMDKLLDSAGIDFSSIEGFAVALGPGSFTSLRVGLATVKALAMGAKKPVVGIPSMDIIFQGAKVHYHSSPRGNPMREDEEICVINDARRGKVYAALYGARGRRSDYLLLTVDDLLKQVQGSTLFVGDALVLYRHRIEEAYRLYNAEKAGRCQCLFADEKWWHPQARVMGPLAFERFQRQDYDDIAQLVPLYLYPQDCQVSVKQGL